MSAAKDCRISGRGRLTVSAELRPRRGLVEGGEVGFVDLGEAAMIVPGGVAAPRAELRRVLHDRYEVGLAAIDAADLWISIDKPWLNIEAYAGTWPGR